MSPLHQDRPAPAVARITLARLGKRNAFDRALLDGLKAALGEVARDASVRAVILTGEGDHFSVGGDISLLGGFGRADFLAFHRDALQLVTALAESPKPIVAAVRGACAGGALGFALCCDTIVAGRSASFSASFLRIGLVPDMGMVHHLRDRLGTGRARRFLTEGRSIEAGEALAIGLCDDLVDDESLDRQALAEAGRLAALPPIALRQTRALLAAPRSGLSTFLDHEMNAAAACFGSSEIEEGMRSFREKRAPRF